MVYVRRGQVAGVRRGVEAWKRFRKLSKEMAMSNLGELLRRKWR